MTRSITDKIEKTKSRIARNASVAIRAEQMIARRRFAMIRTQTGLMAFAGLVSGIGLIMLNVAAFFWLASSLGNAMAGLIVAAVNFVLAIGLAVIASRLNVDQELAPATEVRDMAIAEIETELSETLDDMREAAESLRKITRDPVGALSPVLLGPLMTVLIKSLKK
ncbi:phage holin family protein [Seohaeicola saemankumensis]|nr:phage holin family protein [Seohaeicola saemankumensis]MCA0872822.1 phage holin family protein [Seohaeicola saemankumensis]